MKKEKSVRKAEFQAALFRQLKSLIVPFIILAIILIGVLVISFSQGEAEPEEVVRVNGYEGEETEITLENDKLLFSMNSLTTQFSVTMKETEKPGLPIRRELQKTVRPLRLKKINCSPQCF